MENQQLLAVPLTEEAEDDILQVMSKQFGIQILRLERELSEPPGYRLITNHGAVYLGDVHGLIVAKRFQAAVAATTGVLIPSIKKVAWEGKFAKQLFKICVDVNIVPEATGSPVTKEVKTVVLDGRQTGQTTTSAALRDLEQALVASAYRYEEVADAPELLKRVCKLCDASEEVMTKLEPVRMAHSRACPLTHISASAAR